jgi:hypothetical protein
VARRFERAVIGTVMSVIALIIERLVLKASRGAGRAQRQRARTGRIGPSANGPDERA